MRLLYIVTKGMGDPTLASVPLHIAANGSLDIGQEVSVVLAGDATDLEHRGENNPSVSDLERSAFIRPLERFGHSSVEVLNERQDLLTEILYRDEVAPL
jgi:hypothetical protein